MKPDLKSVAESFGVDGCSDDLNSEAMQEQTYKVAISKDYFPKELWPKNPELAVAGYYTTVKVKAVSRTDAAGKVWHMYGKNWLKFMGPKKASVRKISLHVNDPAAGQGGATSRLTPIQVFSEDINEMAGRSKEEIIKELEKKPNSFVNFDGINKAVFDPLKAARDKIVSEFKTIFIKELKNFRCEEIQFSITSARFEQPSSIRFEMLIDCRNSYADYEWVIERILKNVQFLLSAKDFDYSFGSSVGTSTKLRVTIAIPNYL